MERGNALRVARESTMRLAARPQRVFPLLCPVRELEWIETWAARVVYSDSGVAEKGCVFTTEEPHGAHSIWTVSRYEPAAGAIEFVIVTPGLLVTTLEVSLESDGDGTLARWRRTFTALTPAGERAIGALAGTAHDARMDRLERQLDHYLCTGEMLRS
jgi:hypothetical protein